MANMDSGIYIISNPGNAKFYVGSTINFRHRWGQHLSALRGDRHDNPQLQN